MPKLKFYSNEKVLTLPFGKTPSGLRYALTNYGRVISYSETPEDGRFLKPSLIRGYPALSFTKKNGRQTFLIHRLVAEHFLRKPSVRHRFVIHLNLKKEDNYSNNLKWTTAEEKNRHTVKNRVENEIGNYKLNADRVRIIKKKMLKGNNRLKTIAKQFGVSDMQIHRIKTGENWAHVKI